MLPQRHMPAKWDAQCPVEHGTKCDEQLPSGNLLPAPSKPLSRSAGLHESNLSSSRTLDS